MKITFKRAGKYKNNLDVVEITTDDVKDSTVYDISTPDAEYFIECGAAEFFKEEDDEVEVDDGIIIDDDEKIGETIDDEEIIVLDDLTDAEIKKLAKQYKIDLRGKDINKLKEIIREQSQD